MTEKHRIFGDGENTSLAFAAIIMASIIIFAIFTIPSILIFQSNFDGFVPVEMKIIKEYENSRSIEFDFFEETFLDDITLTPSEIVSFDGQFVLTGNIQYSGCDSNQVRVLYLYLGARMVKKIRIEHINVRNNISKNIINYKNSENTISGYIVSHKLLILLLTFFVLSAGILLIHNLPYYLKKYKNKPKKPVRKSMLEIMESKYT